MIEILSALIAMHLASSPPPRPISAAAEAGARLNTFDARHWNYGTAPPLVIPAAVDRADASSPRDPPSALTRSSPPPPPPSAKRRRLHANR